MQGGDTQDRLSEVYGSYDCLLRETPVGLCPMSTPPFHTHQSVTTTLVCNQCTVVRGKIPQETGGSGAKYTKAGGDL